MEHTCIKPMCSTKYQDADPEPYLCPACKEAKNAIAKKIDAQFASRPRKESKSTIQQLEETGQASMGGGVKMFMRKPAMYDKNYKSP